MTARYLLLIIIVICGGFAESFFNYWPHPNWIPWSILSFILVWRLASPSKAIWLSLLVGVILDLISITPFGLWSLYFIIAATLIYQYIATNRQDSWWRREIVFAVIAALMPLYISLALAYQNPLPSWGQLLPAMLSRGIIAFAATLISWITKGNNEY